MDFARRQLLKYGWEEGKGLGKNESGITEALKPQLKFDTTGVGHDSSEQFTFNWWENVYNHAADNIDVVKSHDGTVNVQRNTEESVDITTKKYSFKKLANKNNLEYGSFLKTAKLTPSGIVEHENKVSIGTDDVIEHNKVNNMSDEELFAACGGRTAHKGARHGLKLNGKLARIEEQEMLMLKKMKEGANSLAAEQNNPGVSNDYEIKLKKKKCKKRKEESPTPPEPAEEYIIELKIKNKKRTHSQTEIDEETEETVQIKTDYYIAKQEKRKKKKLKKLERKKISKLTHMLENVCVSSQQENKDDGFEEKTKTIEGEDECPKKKHKKKKRKLNPEVATSDKDDGFEEYISEVSEKLMYYKELRKDLQEEKKKGDDKRISKMAEDFERKL